jgi:hypothetical protein
MNRATGITAATMGVLLGLSGMNHGFFETLQGNTPTGGMIISAVGEGQRMWLYGGEEAITIVPNFLATGVLAMLVGLGMIVWSIAFLHRKRGPLGFLILFILLFLVGGGVGQLFGFIPAWLASTRINKPLTWWRKVLPPGFRRVLAKLWPWFLGGGILLFLYGLVIAITGFVPGLTDPDTILYVDWTILLSGLGLFILAIIAGFARDIEAAPDTESWEAQNQ